MALVQSVHLLSINGQQPNTVPDLTFPGIAPTATSPCPVFGLQNRNILGLSAATAAQVAAFPPAQSVVYMQWYHKNQRFTGTILTSEAPATIIGAS